MIPSMVLHNMKLSYWLDTVLISSTYISLTEYNSQILYFDNGKNESDKPGKKFHLSSAQTLLL